MIMKCFWMLLDLISHDQKKKIEKKLFSSELLKFPAQNIHYIKSKNEVHRRAKFTKEKLLEMIQVTVPIFFYFDEFSKIRMLRPRKGYI